MDNNQNPWVGLRAYTEGEILYGRDKDIIELTTYVLAETEVVLYGKSGTGKSSIINAGVLPAARRKGFIPLTIRLDHRLNAYSYIDQIRNLLVKEGITIKEVISPHSNNNPLLWEFFHCNEFVDSDGKKVRLLIIFDQFEEIFTLQENNDKRDSFFREIADLLNEVKPRELCYEDTQSSITKFDIANNVSNEDDIFAQIDQLDITKCNENVSFIDNQVHFVFTLREDYLSDFEYYTQKIPALKQHRYAFRPIDEKQAMEIITRPQKGLVSDSVAKQIISKVCKTSNNETNSIGGVDTAILSLFLSQLYQKLPENATAITTDMLDKFGKDIIKDFYISAVSDTNKIRPESVKWIESILLTKDNHRDNKDIKDVLDKNEGLTSDELKYLEKEKHIISRFKRSKITRIEFVHDVIADVAAHHRQATEAEIATLAERSLQEKKAKRKLWLTISICATILFLTFGFMLAFMTKPTNVLPIKHSFIVSFLEDSLTTQNEYWWGDLSIVGHRVNMPDTILFVKEINKSLKDSTYKIEIDTINSVTFAMSFPNNKYQDILFNKDFAELISTLNVPMQLRKKLPKTYPYFGNIAVDINGIKKPVQNVLICLHDITTRTDSSGNFKFYLENEVSEDDDIFIIRKGFSSSDFKALDYLEGDVHSFILIPQDGIVDAVKLKIAEIDSIYTNPGSRKRYPIKSKIYKSDGSTDFLDLVAVSYNTVDHKYLIEGYFYFRSQLSRKKDEDNSDAYYFFKGEIDRDWNNGTKNYSVKGENFIGNAVDITGAYDKNLGVVSCSVTSPVGYNAVFPSSK